MKQGLHDAMTYEQRSGQGGRGPRSHSQRRNGHGASKGNKRHGKYTWNEWQEWYKQWHVSPATVTTRIPPRPAAIEGYFPAAPTPSPGAGSAMQVDEEQEDDEEETKPDLKALRKALASVRELTKDLKGQGWEKCRSMAEEQLSATQPEKTVPSLRKKFDAADKYLLATRKASEDAAARVAALKDELKQTEEHALKVTEAHQEAQEAHAAVVNELASAQSAEQGGQAPVPAAATTPAGVCPIQQMQAALHATQSTMPDTFNQEYEAHKAACAAAGTAPQETHQWMWNWMTEKLFATMAQQQAPPIEKQDPSSPVKPASSQPDPAGRAAAAKHKQDDACEEPVHKQPRAE